MVRWILGAVAALTLFLTTATAQEVVPSEPDIEATIQSQIDAFLEDDFATAFTFASPMIQRMFITPENFGTMVQQGYPMVWRPSDVRFGDLRRINGALWQTVILRDANGVTHVLGYEMQRQGDDWRIAGVQVLAQPEVAA